jgi:hypothetical protein
MSEVKMFFGKNSDQYYGMFTDAGNEAVDGLVTAAKAMELRWPEVYNALCVLADNPKFGEATDTVVREYVYEALGLDSPFYFKV